MKKRTNEDVDFAEAAANMRLNELGQEIPDNTPVAISPRFLQADTLREDVRRLVQTEFSRIAQQEGHGTFEEEDDFDVGDDYDPESPYELDQEDQLEYERQNPQSPDREEPPVRADNDDKPAIQPVGKKSPGSKKPPRENKRGTSRNDHGFTPEEIKRFRALFSEDFEDDS